ncbi:DUF4238 domain-containing protein [Bradyrhizobium sp. DN5]|uniref:DUF4238 domain-containing protein n=1 Tax=Bradyrhizobium sp. DN5 TaxID=3056950 RepID=UPI0035235E84
MSDPSKHHYIPAFYLRQWTTDGFLCEMRKIRGKIVVHSKAPDGTGWQKDLYKIDGVAPELAQHFERTFMHMVDTEAAEAMRNFIGGNMDVPVKERDAWIRFLLSLLFRNPEAVAELTEQVLTLYRESFERLRNSYDELRPSDFPLTLEEFDARTNPNSGDIAASNFLQQIMNSEGIANRIARMRWGRLNLWRSRHTLLTSDRPLCLPMRFPIASVAIVLPIAPRIAFTAAENDDALRALALGEHTTMAWQINQQVVSQARQYVWGLDDRALSFVRKYICTLPDRKLISDEAKELSRKQARGEA